MSGGVWGAEQPFHNSIGPFQNIVSGLLGGVTLSSLASHSSRSSQLKNERFYNFSHFNFCFEQIYLKLSV